MRIIQKMVSSAVKVDLGELIEKPVLLCPIQALHRINDFHDRAHDQKNNASGWMPQNGFAVS